MKIAKDHKPGGIPRTGDLLLEENERLKNKLRNENLSVEERKNIQEKIKKNAEEWDFRNRRD